MIEIEQLIDPTSDTTATILCRTSHPRQSEIRRAIPQALNILDALKTNVHGGQRFSRLRIVLEAVSAVKQPLRSRKVFDELSDGVIFASALDRIVRGPEDVDIILQETNQRLFILGESCDWEQVTPQNMERYKQELEDGLGLSASTRFKGGKRCFLATVSVDRFARTEAALSQLLQLLQPHHAVMSLAWPYDPGHDGRLDINALWRTAVSSQVRSPDPRTVLGWRIWINGTGILPECRGLVLSMLQQFESFVRTLTNLFRRAWNRGRHGQPYRLIEKVSPDDIRDFFLE
ncbi:uncharacterized protein B0T15DRAFT_511797 [Chaetomium strumarium]|uniref:Uncharacterized protein n=1 Tax=Chaetomium strumarium TaxID=1170767 RepID=A0AAJ0GU08_9PEZI|nr:hypothetical protein B0T15DRAFT_511797 [Chaetomium strumarium]